MSESRMARAHVRSVLAASAVAFLLAACGGGTSDGLVADEGRQRPLAANESDLLAQLALPSPAETTAVLSASLRGARGVVDVWVQLEGAPVALR